MKNRSLTALTLKSSNGWRTFHSLETQVTQRKDRFRLIPGVILVAVLYFA